MNDIDMRESMLLAMQVALLGMITPNIRAITCGWNNSEILIKYIYDESRTGDDIELCEEVVTEIMSHFPGHQVKLSVVDTTSSSLFKHEFLSAWVYMRRELVGWADAGSPTSTKDR